MNTALLLRPDAAIVSIQTEADYLITYSIAVNPDGRVYHQVYDPNISRRHSLGNLIAGGNTNDLLDLSVQYRMTIRIDAGIAKALALDDELVVATQRAGAVQCIRWTPSGRGSQTNTESLKKAPWIMNKECSVRDIVYDRGMSLAIWLTSDGRAYAVQRLPDEVSDPKVRRLFRGYEFHNPRTEDLFAVKAAVNARFSLLAVACTNGEIHLYVAKDYVGSIPFSHKVQIPTSQSSMGRIQTLSFSPDGYCLFAGCEGGWMTWSVFGKPGWSSFTSDHKIAEANNEDWLQGIKDASWLGGGAELLLQAQNDDKLWILNFARSSVTGCYASPNISRGLLYTSNELLIYRGYDVKDVTAISGEPSLWHHAQYPLDYLTTQWPIRSTVISADGRYVAVAGRRGLAHYSVNSGRWKTFEDRAVENSFSVRGGMCWYGHILIAAIESLDYYEVMALPY